MSKIENVYKMLKDRCAFDAYQFSFFGADTRELPKSIARLNLPHDFVEYYQQYDGGHQNFSDHGWPHIKVTIQLRLYRTAEMLCEKEKLQSSVRNDLAEYNSKTNRTLPERLKFSCWLQAAFDRLLPVGEIGETAPSDKKSSLYYLLYCGGCFCVLSRKDMVTLALHSLSDWLAIFRNRKDSIYDDTLTGILNKILDIILKGNETIFDLRREQKNQRETEKQTQKKSLYQIISDNAVDVELPAGFNLPKGDEEDSVSWADGAQDGVMLYHFAKQELSDEVKGLLALTIDLAGQGLILQAKAQTRALLEKTRALPLTNLIGEYIYHNKEKLNAAFLHAFATIQMMNADNTECVKFGLAIQAALRPTEETKKAVRTLALCDEFTLFAVANMAMWEDGNQEIFAAAQKVHGWGRIHAVTYLKPETREIRDWFLYRGMDNNILPAYSALECWMKSGAEERLGGPNPASREELTAIGALISAMLDETLMPGLSAVENRDPCILQFLDQIGRAPLSEKDRDVICELAEYYGDEERPAPTIIGRCRELLEKEA